MPSRKLDFPVFDVDNHMYETTDALTKYLPEKYAGLVKYVEVEGRTKIAIRGRISDYIPNPTFEKVAAPGAQEEYFKSGNKEGKSRREIMGKAIASPPAFREPGRTPGADGRDRTRQGGHVADAGVARRGASQRRSRSDPRGDPHAQPVDGRALDVQLREPHLRHAGHHPADRRRGDQGTRVRARATAPRSS